MRNEKLEGVYEGLKLASKIIRGTPNDKNDKVKLAIIQSHLDLLNDYKPINNKEG